MEVKRQRCAACGSEQMQELLLREPGETPGVLVRCARCGALVARYELAGYYHHGEASDPWFASLGVPTESAHDVAERAASARERALGELEAALEALRGDEPR